MSTRCAELGKRIARCLVVLVLGASGSTLPNAAAQQKWPITRFRVFFGERGDLFQSFFHDLTDNQVEDIQSLLRRAAGKLEDMGFPPPRLANTTELTDGNEAYVVYLYDFDGASARYLFACEGEDTAPRIDVNASSYIEEGKIAPKAYSDTAHELFHAVQRGTKLLIKECYPGGWITEGTAEAVGHDIARSLRGSSVEEPGTNRALMRWGGRDYSQPLRVGKLETTALHDLAYQSSSFWRYLAELTEASMSGGAKPGPAFYETDYSYLPRILDETIPGTGEKAELEWIHKALLNDPSIGKGLDEVYPDFAVAMAGYGRRITSSMSPEEVRRRWLSVVFNGCEQATVAPGASRIATTIPFGVVTSDCIEVSMPEDKGQVVVHVSAKSDTPSLLNQLSLGQLGGDTAYRGKPGNNGDEVEWTVSLQAPGPSVIVVSNVAPGHPQDTKGLSARFVFAKESTLRERYDSLLPPLPRAIRKDLLEEFDALTTVQQEALLMKLEAK